MYIELGDLLTAIIRKIIEKKNKIRIIKKDETKNLTFILLAPVLLYGKTN